MLSSSIISIGNELLNGQTVNTNAAYLSDKLLSIGIPTVSCHTVGDEIGSIVQALKLAGDEADIILTTGGLGPTDDDLTRQAFAKFLNKELHLHDELMRKMENFYTSRERQMPEKNRLQAYIPNGAKALVNNLGTAPGFVTKVKNKLFYALPGVPSEMKQMFEESVVPQLKELTSCQAVVIRKLKCFGSPEAQIAELLGSYMQRGRNPLINCTITHGVITLHIIAAAEDDQKAQQLVDKDEKALSELLGKLVYGTGEQTLAEVVGEKLAQQKKTITVAESCTGGLLAKLLTDIPGASRYFTYGWITYSNNAKISELGVPAELIEKHGAVSQEVAEAMAKGAREHSGADFAIGITGIAGPDGGSEQKPVGLVYICVDSDNVCDTKRFIFSHDRDSIRFRAAQTALNMLRLKLQFD